MDIFYITLVVGFFALCGLYLRLLGRNVDD